MFKISLVTDEISSDFETAAELCAQWGIRNIEIRGIGDERIGNHTPYTAHHIKKVTQAYGLGVVAMSPGIFKCDHHAPVPEGATVLKWQDRSTYEENLRLKDMIERQAAEVFPRTLEFALEIGCKKILLFSFNKPAGVSGGECPEYLLTYFRKVCERARGSGVELVIENEHICYGDTALNTKKLIETIGCPELKINWDPGNSYYACETPFPDGYDKIKDMIGHVHMKDAITHPGGSMEYVVKGCIDWEGQLRALIDDKYEGYLSIETHCRPKIKSAFDTLQRILAVTGKAAL